MAKRCARHVLKSMKLSSSRLLIYCFTLWLTVTLNFWVPRLLPGDPLLSLIDAADATAYDENTRKQLEAYHGLDQPLALQYVRYWRNLLRGDLGDSISFRRPVSELVLARLPWTLGLVLPSLVLSSLIGLVLGVQAGWRRGSWVDRALTVSLVTLWNLPAFFIGFALIMLFSVKLQWLPLGGAITRFTQFDSLGAQMLDVLKHWLLPALTLVISTIGGRFLLMRNSMSAVLGQEYILAARAKGANEHALKYRHTMRNAMLPFFTAFSTQIGLAVTGATVIESLFVYPGMGLLLLEAVNTRDYPLVQGAFLVISVTVLTVNLISEQLVVKIDPRMAQ